MENNEDYEGEWKVDCVVPDFEDLEFETESLVELLNQEEEDDDGELFSFFMDLEDEDDDEEEDEGDGYDYDDYRY